MGAGQWASFGPPALPECRGYQPAASGELEFTIFLGVGINLAVDGVGRAGVCVVLSLPDTHSTLSTPSLKSSPNSAIETSTLRRLQGPAASAHCSQCPTHLGLQGLRLEDILGL